MVGVKTQLDRLCQHLLAEYGPFPRLYEVNDDGLAWLNLPSPLERVEEAELLLGFGLPELLREVYLRIGNGGGAMNLCGLCPFLRDHPQRLHRSYDVVAFYRDQVAHHHETYGVPWPKQRLPLFSPGYDLIACIDCSSEVGVIWLMHDGHWEITHPSLVEYIEDPLWDPQPS